MMRALIVVVFALGAPTMALADQFPNSALNAPVISDTGAVVGRVGAVERDGRGRIVAAEIAGLEPPSAPHASQDLVAERAREREALMPARADVRQAALRQRAR